MSPFKRFRTPLIVILFLALTLVLLSISARKPDASRGLERGILEVIGPVQRGGMAAFRFLGSLWDRYFNLVGVQRENELLKARLQKLRAENVAFREAVMANQRLRRLLGFTRRLGGKALAAEVIARDPSAWFKSIIINRGHTEGVRRDMSVLAPGGVVGRVVTVSAHFAKVLLLIDRHAAIDVIIQRTRTQGVVVGTGGSVLRLKYVTRNADVKKGDRVIASGMAGVFPKGSLVGRVATVKRDTRGIFLDVEVEPAVDFFRLEEVVIVRKKPPAFYFSTSRSGP